MIAYILYFSIFVVAFLLFELVASTYSARRQRKRAQNRRMALFQENLTPTQVSQTLKAERGLDSHWSTSAIGNRLLRLYTQSGLAIKFSNLLIISLVVGALLAIMAGYFGAPIWLQAVLVVPLGLLICWFVLSRMRNKRMDLFTRQLPDALDIIVRSLHAGHPLGAAVNLVGREMSDPVGTEFGIVADEMGYGINPDAALIDMLERTGVEDVKFVAISVNIQRQSGGNLAEILGNLSDVIRQRYLMKAKIRALSAEGRFSGKLLSTVPILLFFVIRLLSPTYFDIIWEKQIELYFFGFIVVATLIGNYIISRMVNFDF